MITFDAAHKAVHYPEDRRFRIWISTRTLLLLLAVVFVPLVLAWMQHTIFGLPYIAPTPASPKALRADHTAFLSGFAGAISRTCSFSSFLFAAGFRSLWIILGFTGTTIALRARSGSASRRLKYQRTASGLQRTTRAISLRLSRLRATATQWG